MYDDFDIEMQIHNVPTKGKQTKKNDPSVVNEHMQIIFGLTVLLLLLMGRPFYCETMDYVVWNDSGKHMSQHFLDPYSVTHILHGLITFNVITIFTESHTMSRCITLVLACVWEIVENTSFVIEIYRKDAMHAGYFGDSVINSIGDIVCCFVGWYIAKMIGVHKSIILFIVCECALLIWIDDNLTKNAITLLCTPQLVLLLFGIVWWYVRSYIETIVWNKISDCLKKLWDKLKEE